MVGFYADDVELSIVDGDSPQSPPFQLHGRSKVAKHLRAVYGQGASHRVERAIVDVACSVVFTWVYLYTRGSVLIATLLHGAMNLSQGLLLGGIDPARE
jgi:hypothetical protein